MAHLSIVGSHKVNGVSALHSDLLVKTIFADFARLWPERFTNMTNGVTPRRWLAQANPGLAGAARPHARQRLAARPRPAGAGCARIADDAALPRRVHGRQARQQGAAGATLIAARPASRVDPASLFDVQVKRIHEYKRQLLNLLHVVTRYQAILAEPAAPTGCRARVIFAGKAASATAWPSTIIRLIHDVGSVDQQRPARRRPAEGRVRAELRRLGGRDHHARRRPVGADLDRRHRGLGHRQHEARAERRADHRHRSTAPTSRSAKRVGDDNIFIFGLTATPEVAALRRRRLPADAPLRRQPGAARRCSTRSAAARSRPTSPAAIAAWSTALLWGGDHYLLLADYDAYVAAQARVDALYREPAKWAAARIANVAGMGTFSSRPHDPRVRGRKSGVSARARHCIAAGAGRRRHRARRRGGVRARRHGDPFAVLGAHARREPAAVACARCCPARAQVTP